MLGIIEPRYSRNNRPQFQAEFHVPEEKPDGPKLGPPSGSGSTPHRHQYPTPRCLPVGGVTEMHCVL